MRPALCQVGVFSTDRRDVLLDVGAVGQVGEYGVHVLHVSDANGQISQSGQGPQFILILIEFERERAINLTVQFMHTGVQQS